MATVSTYLPPGTNVSEVTTQSINPLLAAAANVCIIGVAGLPASSLAQLTTTDVVLLTGTTAVTLPTLASLNNDALLVSVASVTDVLNPSVGTPLGAGYVATTDYTITTGMGPPDGTNGQITRVGAGNIPNGTLVAVTYTYVPSDYWNPIRLFDIGSVEARFGPSWAQATNPATGQIFYTGIGSQLSFAARMAFANGAASVVCQPLFSSGGIRPGQTGFTQVAPTNVTLGNSATWGDTLAVLRPFEDIDIIVPIIGQDVSNVSATQVLNVFGAVQSHLSFMNTQQRYVVAIFGEDGTSSATNFQNLLGSGSGSVQAHAGALQSNFANALSSQCVLLNNTVFKVPTPGGYTNQINVGGQYAAAAFAGAVASRPVASSMTHGALIGFTGIVDPRLPTDKNNDAGAGLCVIEQTANLIRCRQAITLDIQDGVAKAELSVVRAKFLMMASIRQTIDNQIIGQIIADGNSPMIVRSAIAGVLTLLHQAGAIVAFNAPIASITSTNPTIITASFSYRPAFPVDYVNVSFALDLSSGTITGGVTNVATTGV